MHAEHEVKSFEEVPPGLYRMKVLMHSSAGGTMHEFHASYTPDEKQLLSGAFVFECLSATHEWHVLQAQLLQQRAPHLIHPPESCMQSLSGFDAGADASAADSGMHAGGMQDIVGEVLNLLEDSVRTRCHAIDPRSGPPSTWYYSLPSLFVRFC